MTEAKLDLIQLLNINPIENSLFIERVKTSIENHEHISQLLYDIKENLEKLDTTKEVTEIIEAIDRSHFNLNVRKVNQHPIICAVDTFLPITLLLNPTSKMQETAGKISQVISDTLAEYLKNDFVYQGRDYGDSFQEFAKTMIFESSNTYPGAFKLNDLNQKIKANPIALCEKIMDPQKPLSNGQVKFIIKETINLLNNSKSLRDVMVCHTNYGYELVKKVAMINQPQKNISPVLDELRLQFPELVNAITQEFEFLTRIRNPAKINDKYRQAISDDLMYDSAFFRVESTRGRAEIDNKVTTNSYGLIRGVNNGVFRDSRLQTQEYEWIDWTNCVFLDTSIIVSSMVEYETPFISSFSGTTSLLMNVMIQSGVLTTPEEQQIYLQNVIAYIASVGFHSIHEIVAPVAHCLKLIDSNIYPTDLANALPPPPHYHSFYQLASANDPEFEQRRQESWIQLMEWHQNVYQKHPYLSNKDILGCLTSKKMTLSRSAQLQLINDFIKEVKEDKEVFEYLVGVYYASSDPKELAVFDYFLNRNKNSYNTDSYYYKNSSPEFKIIFRKINPEQSNLLDIFMDFNKKSLLIEIYIEGNKLSFRAKMIQNGPYYIQQYFMTPDVDNAFKDLLRRLNVDKPQIEAIYDTLKGRSKILKVFISDADLETKLINNILRGKLHTIELINNRKLLFTELKNKMLLHSPSTENILTVIKEDEERGCLVFRDKIQVHKWFINPSSMNDMKLHLDSEKKLFESVNFGKLFSFHIENYFSRLEMSYLGEPLSELIERFSPVEIDNLMGQAINLIKAVHQNGFIYGDVSLDNFIYDKQNTKLYLVDFESSLKLENSPYVALSIINTNTLKQNPEIDPKRYTQTDDLTILNKLFTDLKVIASHNTQTAVTEASPLPLDNPTEPEKNINPERTITYGSKERFFGTNDRQEEIDLPKNASPKKSN